jgi:putative DNA primase/helicase
MSGAGRLGERYLRDRGIKLEYARANGVSIETHPSKETVQERLGQKCVPLWKMAQEVIWFRGLIWIARPLPTLDEKQKFLTPVGNDAAPYIPPADKANGPLFVTEGPVKALVLTQAGFRAVGLNGVWCAASPDKDTLRTELVGLGVNGCDVYLAFDADAASNPKVRHALIRAFFLLRAAGASVWQLTTWKESEGKGVDDYLVRQTKDISEHRSVIEKLIEDSCPFAKCIQPKDLAHIEAELATVKLSRLQRDQLCHELWNPLGVRLDTLLKVGSDKEPGDVSRQITFPDPAPWPEPVNGHELIQDLIDLVRKHVVLGDYSVLTVTLWGLLTYFADREAIDTLPMLAITSPDKRCGKTRLQDVLEWIVRRPLAVSNISTASVFRVVEAHHPTLLMDEADTYTENNEELRGVFNSGHTRQKAFVIRCHPVTLEPEKFNTWCPKSFGLIGSLPGTMQDRSIVIRMERKKRSERVEPLRATTPVQREEFASRIIRWASDKSAELPVLDTPTIQELSDRAADNWVPLLQVATLLGQDWYDLARKAMIALNPDGEATEDVTAVLLRHLQELFSEDLVESETFGGGETDGFIATTDLLAKLNADGEAPWAGWRRGDGLSQEKLASLLKHFGVKSEQTSTKPQRRGYRKSHLQPVFDRYVAPIPRTPP